MLKFFIRTVVLHLTAAICFTSVTVLGAGFTDVPAGHYAYTAINGLRDLGVIEGIDGERFGLGQQMKLGDLAKWISSATGVSEEVFTEAGFNRDAAATREQAAVMMIKAAGYEKLAGKISGWGAGFQDVTESIGYINMAKDFGIMSGVGDGKFLPRGVILREQAATALFNLQKKLNISLQELNAFYAIQSSGQRDFIGDLTSVGFGWSRIEYDSSNEKIILNTIKSGDNEYGVPDGFSAVVTDAEKSGAKTLLMVTGEEKNVEGVSVTRYVISDPAIRKTVIADIKTRISRITRGNESATFDGVIVDLENLKGATDRKNLTAFVTELRESLGKEKLIYVAVHPARRKPHEYFDAYDFRGLGQQADRIILMAHDYNAKALTEEEKNNGVTTTPLAPIDEVYYGLLAITDPVTGVADRNKIMLQISFDSAQWKVKDGIVTHSYPYRPDYSAIAARMAADGSKKNYSDALESPYLTFDSPEDGSNNILWYEDVRSVNAKIKLAAMFGVNKISLWRLGIIPAAPDMPEELDVWGAIKREKG